MSVMSEFKQFAMRGNVTDMAIGIIIGGAFGKIVASMVNDIIMPPIGLLVGGMDFKSIKIVLREATMAGDKIVKEAVTLNLGNFIQTTVDFVIVAFAIFMLIKGLNSLQKKKEQEPEAAPAPPPAISNEEKLLSEIRDILKSK